jgi:hypothetical protein
VTVTITPLDFVVLKLVTKAGADSVVCPLASVTLTDTTDEKVEEGYSVTVLVLVNCVVVGLAELVALAEVELCVDFAEDSEEEEWLVDEATPVVDPEDALELASEDNTEMEDAMDEGAWGDVLV